MYADMDSFIQRSKRKVVSMHKHKTQGSPYKKKKKGSIHVCVHVQKSKSKVKNINKKTDMQIYTFGIKTAQIIESLIRYTVNKIKFF